MRTLIIVLLILIACVICGCDDGLEIIGMEVNTYPEKTKYYARIDTELDLTGGTVNYILKQKTKSEDNMVDEFITVTHEIDFNTPGIYTVTLERHKGICQFEIEVVKNDK